MPPGVGMERAAAGAGGGLPAVRGAPPEDDTRNARSRNQGAAEHAAPEPGAAVSAERFVTAPDRSWRVTIHAGPDAAPQTWTFRSDATEATAKRIYRTLIAVLKSQNPCPKAWHVEMHSAGLFVPEEKEGT